ncbi:hypothetical protein KPH14_009338 [Odynerus spinipes]|uniref:Uncharacterized protein n=1 Tax=Odynerus spinipes TaxID=1348599 RepID=A0AAD9VQU0_9HYME|nr:hypothetical protein KPH14_009338 [Odynerus spinipes]
MDRRRGSRYQLSSDIPFSGRKDSTSRFSLIPPVSPISRHAHKHIPDVSSVSENKLIDDSEYHSYNQNSIYDKFSSTPISQCKKDGLYNTDARYNKTNWSSPKKTSPMFAQNHTLMRGENSTLFSPNGSPWGTSISPKMRSKAGGVKTVQTVAGPLLASTRYNIDPKTYTDVTSPGLTTRLTKYAAEANNKLTHQSQYGTGQFPKVNLNVSPIPLINTKSPKIRGPVTVRIAPPGRQKSCVNPCNSKPKKPLNVVEVLREISLKRHASREDVMSDLVKKQRIDSIFVNDVENFEETKQKRGRDESSKSEEEISPQNKNVRPTKRSKTPSCYDILRSLSSSIHVSSGIKRKAADFSRSGTPDFEKHFKSLENMQNVNSQACTQTESNDVKQSEVPVNEQLSASSNLSKSLNSTQEQSPMKGILKTSKDKINSHESKMISPTTQVMKFQCKESETSMGATKFTDKLFMRAEPQRNEKLKSLVEEQGNIKAKFTSDDVEEIKKEDIVNMRQTSMRARLQSMFDAISGKASRINPDVVIQAEEVSEVTPAFSSSANCATLNSVTTTTNVNTTPIITSAIAPTLMTSESKEKPVKHITFNLPNTNDQVTSNLVSNEKSASVITPVTSNAKAQVTPATSSESTNALVANSLSATSNPITSTFVSNKTVTNTSTVTPVIQSVIPLAAPPVTSNEVLKTSIPTFSTSSSSISTAKICMPVVSSTSSNIFTSNNTIPNFTTVPSILNTTNVKTTIGNSIPHNVNTTGPAISTDNTKFTFGNISNPSTQAHTVFGQNVATSGISFTTETKSMTLPTSNVAATAASTFRSITDNVASIASNKSLVVSTATTTVPFIFGSTNIQTPKTEVSLFNTMANNAPKTFGISGTAQPNSIPANTSTIASSSVPHNSMLTLPNGTFSGNVSSGSSTFTINTATPIFSFGASNASTSENKSGFSYNANALGSSKGLSANAPVTCSTSSNTTPAFNVTSANTTAQFTTTTTQFTATTASMFNTASTTSMFRTTNSEPVFGQSIAAPLFGPSTKPSPFVPIQPTKSSIDFGTNNNIFKEEKPPAFGANTTVFGSTSTPLFGSQTTVVPTFGSPSVSTSALTFGSTNTTTPAFGTQNISAPETAHTSTSHSFGTSNPMFGNQNNPAPLFGSTTTTPVGTFNTPMQNSFGSPSSSQIAFGATNNNNNNNTFGDNKMSPFGVQSTAAPAFGTNESNNTSSIFTFSGNQGQQQNTFSFGNNSTSNNNASTTGSVPFQFGANTSKSATGFNFTAPSTTPSITFGTSGTPSFNAPTAGMFSIGSGSTAPRSRTVRGRKPR